jgi:putative RNA 2'-phosphotransferase
MSRNASKFLSLVLRHDPGSIGITLDGAGWTDVDALLAALGRHGQRLTRAELVEIVASSDKQRFALSDDGARIRANQGHSVAVDLELPAATPPELLFHGTVGSTLDGIRARGLQRGQRHHVHLSAETGTATKVGSRRGAPVILTIRAGAMAAAGYAFYRSENGVWLVDEVPPQFIDFPPPPAPSRGDKVAIAKATLAACEAGSYEGVDLAPALASAKAGTRTFGLDAELPAQRAPGAMTVRVTAETTIEALVRLGDDRHVACLNFASAKNPGGGFLGGAQAQEESLARSSGLYPCLLTQVTAHYEPNRRHGSALYLDLAIWSPRVPFFRTDDGGWLPRPLLASVITCAAPNAGALAQHGKARPDALAATLHRRAGLVLAIAAHHGVERLVLGAWGAGVFRNDPAMVADAFAAQLDGPFAGAFAEVVFAVIGGPGNANYDAFSARFACP